MSGPRSTSSSSAPSTLVVQAGGFSAAASRLHRTQSAVSHAVAQARGLGEGAPPGPARREVRPTEEGKRLHEACESVFATLDAAQEELQQEREPGGRTDPPRGDGGVRLQRPDALHPAVPRGAPRHRDGLRPEPRPADAAAARGRRPGHRLRGASARPSCERTPALPRGLHGGLRARLPARPTGSRSPSDLSRCTVLSLDKGCAWWERFLAAFPKTRRPAFGRVIAINHIRGLITAAVHGLGVLIAPSYSLQGELERGALGPSSRRSAPSRTGSASTRRPPRRAWRSTAC